MNSTTAVATVTRAPASESSMSMVVSASMTAMMAVTTTPVVAAAVAFACSWSRFEVPFAECVRSAAVPLEVATRPAPVPELRDHHVLPVTRHRRQRDAPPPLWIV
jgi:hypothetical protein